MPGFAEITEFIKSVGIPASVAFFILWRLDKRLQELVAELQSFHAKIGGVVTTGEAIKEKVEQEATRVIHEVDHNFRGVIIPWIDRRLP